MDKISKRSKGFAFIEYTTEEAASEALRVMNGKVTTIKPQPSLLWGCLDLYSGTDYLIIATSNCNNRFFMFG